MPPLMPADFTHFKVSRRGDDLAMVQLGNGSFSITRNGEPIAGCRWSVRQLVAAVRHFRALSEVDGDELSLRRPHRPLARVPFTRNHRDAVQAWDDEGGARGPL